MAISKQIKKIGNKIVDVTSDIMSAPARIKANNSKSKADSDVKQIKTVREMKNVPDEGDERDPLFRMRVNVSNMKTDSQRYSDEYARKMSPKPKRF